MNSRGRVFLLVLALVTIGGIIAYRFWSGRSGSSSSPSADPASTASTRPGGPSISGAAPGAAGSAPKTSGGAASQSGARIEGLFAKLQQGGGTPEELAEFRQALTSDDPHAAILAIRAFLASGRDAKTQEPFQVGA